MAAGYPRPVLDTVYQILLVSVFGLMAWCAVYAVYRIFQGQR